MGRGALLLLIASAAAAGPLDPPRGGFKVESVEVSTRSWGTQTLLRFPSPVKSPWPANDTVWAHLMVPHSAAGRRVPAVLVLPVMAAPNVWIETRFTQRFVHDGLVVMWVEMPTQFHRRPHPSMPSGQVFLGRTPRRLAANLRQSVLDARRALGVLAARPETDPERITLFGISLGALVGSVVYSVDPRPCFAVFLLGGADFPSLVRNGSLSGPFVRAMGIQIPELKAALVGLDPLEHRERNAGKPTLLINARSDTVIPRANALFLASAFPAARQIWLPLGHYSAIAHLVWLPRWVSKEIVRQVKSSSGLEFSKP
ncbi:MAG: hypothetical protein AAB262_14315 [Elusimicrobiota bacterium]